MERLRLTGDMILTYQRQIEPGQTELTGAMDLEAPPITARLDPALTPVENAQAYYDRYRRKRKASRALPRRVAHVRAELATLEQLGADIELAESRPEIDAVGDALLDRSAGANSGSRRAHGSQVGGPLRLRSSDGFVLLVGRNSRQNETVTFGRASRADLWLHARGLPGGHVVIKAAGRRVPERTLLEAAGLALRFSGARGEGRAEVIVTEVRHVRHLRGGGPGMVTYDHEKTMVASPLDPAELDRARTTDML
jgi:predicted ribosome quality control (RQC) complex YloA/Tae2 family protein